MFSGIVQRLGKIVSIVGETQISLVVETELAEKCQLGDSVAVNGVCLTVTKIEGDHLFFDVVHETIKKTNLKHLRNDSLVNLELSLTLADYIGGHLVQGHVDGCGTIQSITEQDDAKEIRISLSSELSVHLIEKGFVAIDGMSITIIEVGDNYFTITLIPHTLKNTVAHSYQVGTEVNLEVDMISKYIQKHVRGTHHDI